MYLEHVGGGGCTWKMNRVGGVPGTCRGWGVYRKHVEGGGCTWNM